MVLIDSIFEAGISGCGAVLVAAGLLKIADARQLQQFMNGSGLVPQAATPAAVRLLAITEILVGTVLIYGEHRILSLVSGLALSGVFILVVSIAKLRQLNEGCGCFGSAGGSGRNAGTLIRPALLFVYFAASLWWYATAGAQANSLLQRLATTAVGVSVGSAVVLIFWASHHLTIHLPRSSIGFVTNSSHKGG